MAHNLKKLTVIELQAKLRENRLPVTGNKETLIQRLTSIVFSQGLAAGNQTASNDQSGPHNDNNDINGPHNNINEIHGSHNANNDINVITVDNEVFVDANDGDSIDDEDSIDDDEEPPLRMSDLRTELEFFRTDIIHTVLALMHGENPDGTNRPGNNITPNIAPTQPSTSKAATKRLNNEQRKMESQQQRTLQEQQHNNEKPRSNTQQKPAQRNNEERNHEQRNNEQRQRHEQNLAKNNEKTTTSNELSSLDLSDEQDPSPFYIADMAKFEKKVTSTNHNRTDVLHAADNMPEFDPESEFDRMKSASAFITRLRALQNHYKWSDFLLLEAAQLKLRGEAKRWNDGSPQVYATFEAFEADLRAAYPACTSTADAIEEIFSTKRGVNEGLEAFCRRLMVIGRRANLPDTDLVQYFLKRVGHTAFLTAIACNPPTNTADLLRSIASFVQTMPEEPRKAATPTSSFTQPRNQQRNTTEHQPTMTVNQQRATTSTSSSSRQTMSQPAGEVKCWNCRERGHTTHNCPQPRLKCTKCQRFGHHVNDCRSEARPARIFMIDGDRDEQGDENGVIFEKQVTIQNMLLNAYIDGGTHCSLIARTVAEKLGGVRETGAPVTAKGFAAEPITCIEKVTPEITVDGKTYTGDLLIVDDCYLEPNELLLGTDLLCGVGRFILIGGNKCTLLPNLEECAAMNRAHVEELLQRYAHCFSNTLSTIGKAKTTTIQIELTSNVPVSQRACRIPFAKRPLVSEMVNELLVSGIVVKSNSPYTSQLVIVKKNNGEDRMCVDYRPINAITVKQPFPMPVIEELLAKLAGNRYFTTLDFMSGYYQIPVHNDSRKYTAFDTHEGHYEFTRMPFGLVNAPGVFQECINSLLARVPKGEAIAYLDDVVVPSATIEEGVQRLQRLFKAIEEVGLTLRMDKCVFLSERIKFLGHNVSSEGIEPGDGKVAAIRDFPPPTNIHEVRRFLGLTGFFRKFVQNYARIAKPLTELTKTVDSPPYVWGKQQIAAFQALKECLCNEPVLCLYDTTHNHEVHTDASSSGLAGVLLQQETDNNLHPVFYFSRHCSPAEAKYASHELEVLAIVESLERFRVYLLGKKFRVVTDCAAVATTKTTKPLVPRIARWWLKLQEFDFELSHRPGTQLAHVDAMSRAPVEPARDDLQVVTEQLMRIDISQTDWIVTMQLQDENLQRIVDILNGKSHSKDERQLKTVYELKNNRLYRNVDGRLRWVVPNAVRWRVVKSAHDDRGHFGLEKTVDYLRREFWFAGMRNYVQKYLQACFVCSVNKKSTGASEGEMHMTKTVPTPFRTIHIDHLGPFPKSSKGNAYVIAVVDSFSKYVVVKATRSTDTRGVVNLLNEMTMFFGLPARIVSDRGTAFTSKQFNEYCQRNAIQHVKNAVRTPRANGQVERFNQMITTFLRTSNEDARKWDCDLRNFQWVVNSQVNRTIGCCPNEVIFRYRLRANGDNQLLAALHETDEGDEHPDLPKLDDIARAADEAKAKWKTRFDNKHRSPTKYDESDLVLVEHIAPATGESRKLEPRYRGPYVVKKVLGNDRYLVADLPDIQRNQRPFESVFASDKLKRWCSLGPESSETNDDNNNDDDNNEGEYVEGDAITGLAELSEAES